MLPNSVSTRNVQLFPAYSALSISLVINCKPIIQKSPTTLLPLFPLMKILMFAVAAGAGSPSPMMRLVFLRFVPDWAAEVVGGNFREQEYLKERKPEYENCILK